jgi:hypothetical protein
MGDGNIVDYLWGCGKNGGGGLLLCLQSHRHIHSFKGKREGKGTIAGEV